MAPYIATDMSLVDMIRLAQALKGAGSKNLYTATAKGEWSSPFIYVDQANLDKLVKDDQEGRAVREAEAETGRRRRSSPPSVTVTVRNGSGMSGVANQAATILKAKDFKIKDVGNAGQNVYKKTLIIYKTDHGRGESRGEVPAAGHDDRAEPRHVHVHGQVLVVVGKDWDVSKVPAAPVVTQ